jgi:hypothetical protein
MAERDASKRNTMLLQALIETDGQGEGSGLNIDIQYVGSPFESFTAVARSQMKYI